MNQKYPDGLCDLEQRLCSALFHAADTCSEIILSNLAEETGYELGPWDRLTVELIHDKLKAFYDSILLPDVESPSFMDDLESAQTNKALPIRARCTEKVSLDADFFVDAVENSIVDGLLRNNKKVRESVSQELQNVRNAAVEYGLVAEQFEA